MRISLKTLYRSIKFKLSKDQKRRQYMDRAISGDLSPSEQVIFARLVDNGVCADGADNVLQPENRNHLAELIKTVESEQLRAEIDRRIVEGQKSDTRKSYRQNLAPLFDPDRLISLAEDRSIQAIINKYFGFHCCLRYLSVLLDYPIEGGPVETQVWHRDADDIFCVKVFIPLTDVALENGPFSYIPKSHNSPYINHGERVDDASMAKVFPEREWFYAVGQKGSIVFADTNGYHKGQQPTQDLRMMIFLQYTSPNPAFEFSPMDIELDRDSDFYMQRGAANSQLYDLILRHQQRIPADGPAA